MHDNYLRNVPVTNLLDISLLECVFIFVYCMLSALHPALSLKFVDLDLTQ